VIEIRNLCFRYPGCDTNAIDSISLDIADSGFVAIMGSNGSGKSTFAHCLNGLIAPFSGSVVVDGLRTDAKENLREVRRRVGLVFQDPNTQITSVTVERELAFGLENLCISTAEMRMQVDEQLKKTGLEGYRYSAPSSLSAGEKQRLAIASVLIMNPKYVILDEATSLLSGASRKSILEVIRRAKAESKICPIVITQFPSEALLAERLVVLHGGRVIFDAAPEEVFRHVSELSALGVPIPIRSRLQQLQ
jgi:energy-coupling factor transport system ATP-binding protein